MHERGMELAALESRWDSWRLARNRRGTATVLWLVICLYPLFGVLDYLTAPKEFLGVLYGTRVLVCVITLAMFRIVRTQFFDTHADFLSSGYMVLISFGISLMTTFMGGLASPYYAGLSLTTIATGLLFVWPSRIVVATHGTTVMSFIVPNLALGAKLNDLTAVSNLFFLASTAVIAGTGQILGYRTQREQVANQLLVEATKASLERANAQLQELDRYKSEFFANITHELKTPLTMILAPLELMLHGDMGKISEAQRASLQSMLRSGVKLLKLIGNLLDLSKLDESRLRLQVAEHDLVAYLRELVAQVQALAQRKSIALTFEADVGVAPIYCDLERLERVFVNLLSNAAKFTEPHGSIRVRLADEGDRVRISVSDTGIGFPSEMAERIFGRFVQADGRGSRTQQGGTGIGLALARELVRLHGGTIAADGRPGEGATFTVSLFKGRDHFDPNHLDRRSRQRSRNAGNRESDQGIGDWHVEAQSQFRFIDIDEATDQRIVERDTDEDDREQSVLVVEDTPDVIRVIHLALRRSFRVFAATSGQKGLQLAKERTPSLIITDLMMPEMDGMELTRRLRADQTTKHIPIIMLTARGDAEDRAAGMNAGVNAYLTKPFAAKELLSTVAGLVRIQETSADLLLTHSMDSLQTIAGGLAHEINNPLNFLRNASATLKTDADWLLSLAGEKLSTSDDRRERLERLSSRMERMFEVTETGLRRIGATVELMQQYSREGFTRVLQPVDLFAATRNVVTMLQAGFSQPMIETFFEGEGEIECVPEEANQVLTNLIQNALDALPNDRPGRVHVRGWSEGENLVLSVRDNGTGIPPELRARIFTPFFTTKEVGRGMGLGLSIVWRVITSLGGTVCVNSQEGVGTEFTLRVPRSNSDSATPSVPTRAGGSTQPKLW